MEEHLITGSLFTLFIQMVIGIVFLDLALLFHAAFFGVGFINVPVIIKSAILALFGNFHTAFIPKVKSGHDSVIIKFWSSLQY